MEQDFLCLQEASWLYTQLLLQFPDGYTAEEVKSFVTEYPDTFVKGYGFSDQAIMMFLGLAFWDTPSEISKTQREIFK